MTLDFFFSPKSVAVIGASHTPGKVGYEILDDLIKGNFQGGIYAVNPDTTPILNKTVYPSVKGIPGEVELAVIAIPAKDVPNALRECSRKKVKGAIVISGGFSEIGEEGKKLEDKTKAIIKKTKLRVIGGNCLGVYDAYSSFDTLFLPEDRMERPKTGNIAFISQSGAVGSTILDWYSAENIGISKFVSYGNAMDVNETHLLEYLEADEKTKVIVAYLEGIKGDGKQFMKVLGKTTKRKPVIVIKSGKTEKGAKAVFSHTGSLAGSSKIYSSVFKQTGAIEAANWQELFDYSKAFSMQPLPRGDKVLIVTNGGGFGILATDEAERNNLKLDDPQEAVRKKLSRVLPSYVSLHNPVDLTGDVTADRYRVVLENLVQQYDGAVVIILFQVPLLEESVVDVLIEMKHYEKPILCVASGGNFTKKMTSRLEHNNIPVYPTPERAVKTFAAMLEYVKAHSE